MLSGLWEVYYDTSVLCGFYRSCRIRIPVSFAVLTHFSCSFRWRTDLGYLCYCYYLGVRCFYLLTICQRLCCNLLRSHCKNKKSSHHSFSNHLCCCFESRRFSLLHDELCCSKAMAVCRNVWFQNRPMYIRTCHRNEPHMDISRYGKKGLLFNSLGENRRKKK